MPAPDSTTISTPDGQSVEYPARLVTVAQLEHDHPALEKRVRGFILRADAGVPDYAGLQKAVVRLGRSVYIDQIRFLAWLDSRRGAPPEPARNPSGRAGRRGK